MQVKPKPPTNNELRMKASKFDKMMQRALSATPPEPEAKPKKQKEPVEKDGRG